jgi:amino acid adenylation domain-containing protein
MNNLIKKIQDNNILLEVKEEQLQVFSAADGIDPALLDEIRANKAALIQFLKSNDQAAAGNSLKVNIPCVPVQTDYELSSAQHRLWILSQFEESSVAYHMTNVYQFEGSLDIAALEYAFDRLIDRHEILRTVFRANQQGNVRQFIYPSAEKGFKITVTDISNEVLPGEKAEQLLAEEAARPFDLAAGPLLRASLLRLSDSKWVFAFTMHHIISDGWSMNNLLNELLLFYKGCSTGTKEYPAPLAIQYKDYAAWQQEQLKGDDFEAHKSYWLQQLEGELPVMQLSGARPRMAMKTYNGGIISNKIQPDLYQDFASLVKQKGATLFMGLHAAVRALLCRYTGQQDIIIGSPAAGREHADLENQIGFYLNLLPIRTRFAGTEDFFTLLDTVKKVTLGAYEHQVYPFDKLIDDLQLQRDMSRSPLFDVLIDFHENTAGAGAQSLGGLSVSAYEGGGHTVSKFDLTFYFIESAGGLHLTLEYNSDLYERSFAERLYSHFEELLCSIVSSPSSALCTLNYISSNEQTLLKSFNIIAPNYTGQRSVLSLFSEQVSVFGSKPAVCFNGEQLSYQALDGQSNQLAHYLTGQCGVKRGDLVGVLLDRSANMLIALLGILKSGCAYVPIDVDYPQGRKAYIIGDTGIKVLLTQTEYMFDLPFYSGTVYAMDIQQGSLDTSTLPCAVETDMNDLAYVIYTSGSTGNPKGCMLTHGNLSSYIQWANQHYFNNSSSIVFGLFTSLSFDLTVTSIFCPLTLGGTVHVYGQQEGIAAILGHSFSSSSGITSIKLTPSHISVLKELGVSGSSMQHAIAGGEAITGNHVAQLTAASPFIRIYNEYGPTESTVGCSVKELKSGEAITIGRPVYGTQLYVLDERQALCGVGVPGEICISGLGVAVGYLNNEALTASKFVSNPYSGGSTLYRTGDLGMWQPDGELLYLGRIDEQVKIRGHRIEPGEIAHVLEGCAGIESAVVLVTEGSDGDKSLVAYITGSGASDVSAVRGYAQEHLPVYMVPNYFVELERLPLTVNGKVDRRQLPHPEGLALSTGTPYAAPQNEMEMQLAAMWQDILTVNRAGTNDNFFTLGGHSLKAMQLIARINKAFGINYNLGTLFSKPTIRETAAEVQAALINMQPGKGDSIIPEAPRQADYPLSSSQFRLWILSQFEEGNIAYNIPGVYLFEGELNLDALQYSFGQLIERHEILRTVFRQNSKGEIRQVIQSPEELSFTIFCNDMRGEASQDGMLEACIENACNMSFDLATGPLLYAGLYMVADNKWVFVHVMHHIISDGWSAAVLLNELQLFYGACCKGEPCNLAPLRIQYKDYAVWQQQGLADPAQQEHKAYWVKQFERGMGPLNISKQKHPVVPGYAGDVLSFEIDAGLTAALQQMADRYNGTLFMSLLLFVKLLLGKSTGSNRVTVGTSIGSRSNQELENQVGMYLNNLPLATDIDGGLTLKKLFMRVKNTVLDAISHQDYPLDAILDDIGGNADSGKQGLFNILAELHTHDIQPAMGAFSGLQITPYDRKATVSAFDISFDFTKIDSSIHCLLTYNTGLFHRREIVLLKKRFLHLLHQALAQYDEDIKAGDIDLRLEPERAAAENELLSAGVSEMF